MNKKFLSVILFGALMTVSTGTFVSCKDYDDDINNLQEQIDGQKNDLNSKITAVESSISSLQTAQSSLQSEIAAAKDEASKAALAAQEAAIATAKAELEKVKADCKELESKMGSSEADEPGFAPALRPVVFRAYQITNEWFGKGKRVTDLESYLYEQGKRLFVERVRQGGIIKEVTPNLILKENDEVVLSGRREFVIGEEDWIGPEVIDAQLLDFPAETLPVMITRKTFAGETINTIRAQKCMHGVSIRSIKRAGINVPVLAQTVVDAGDMLELTGMKREVELAAKQMGYVDRPTNQTDMIFVGLGILVGGLVGALTIHLGGIPISLSTSGGALIAGLLFGWLRSKRPTFGGIPEPSLWVLNNVGLNMFIAVVGIAAGPSFVTGFKEVGASLFIVGALATAIPLISGLLMGRYLFKFHPALTLGCTAGARTTTAALGAVQDAVESETPALGYTVTYAVGNTLLIIWGVFIVLMM